MSVISRSSFITDLPDKKDSLAVYAVVNLISDIETRETWLRTSNILRRES